MLLIPINVLLININLSTLIGIKELLIINTNQLDCSWADGLIHWIETCGHVSSKALVLTWGW